MKKSRKIIYALLIISAVVYIATNIYIRQGNKVSTVYATAESAYKTVEADCFVIRDEVRGGNSNDALVKNSGSGVYVPYIADGARVASGDTIALFFTSQTEAKAYREKQELEAKLESYKQLRDQSLLSYLDIDRLDLTIKDEFNDILTNIEKNDFSDIDSKLDSLKYDISSRQIATGEKVDFKAQINNIKDQIKELSGAGINYKKIKAKYPGCFISSVDGYENAVSYSSVEGMSVDKIQKSIDSDPAKVKDNVIGKIVGEYNWYAVCNLPYTSLENIKVGSKVRVGFKDTGVNDIEMTVASITTKNGDTAGVVLKSGLMNSEIANLRKEKIVVTLKEYNGLKVPKEAVRKELTTVKKDDGTSEEKEVMGVYILYGQVVRFRTVNALYSDADYVIAENDTENKESISLYDMIITKGRELYDGKIVY